MIEEKIKTIHSGDEEQINFIFSDSKHISVIAPAGSGKTTAMISKIAYDFSKGKIPNNKKILALTYSVAGAMKIKESLKELLPKLINEPTQYLNRIDTANYHSFAMRILGKYGFYINHNYSNISAMKIVDDTDPIFDSFLTATEETILKEFNTALNNADIDDIEVKLGEYWKLLSEKIINQKVITYNGILVSAIKLLDNPIISHFYSTYYNLIIVDEFQDTNLLGLMLLKKLINSNRSIILGDNMQKIYGFIGALPNAFNIFYQTEENETIEFHRNYRFQKNIKMMQLDTFIRDYGDNYSTQKTAEVNYNLFDNENAELSNTINVINYILSKSDSKIAILLRGGKKNQEAVINKLNNENINYFNSLYNDTDIEVKKFYEIAIEELNKSIHDGRAVIRNIHKWLLSVKQRKNDICTKPERLYIFDSLYCLLEILFQQSKILTNSPQERFEYISLSLNNKGLKNMMEHVESNIILSTIHSSKGLEWDYVFIPMIYNSSFPSYYVCKKCRESNWCTQGNDYCTFNFPTEPEAEKIFKEELSIFYVALTRARKDVFLSSNREKNQHGYSHKRSCFLHLKGLSLKSYDMHSLNL